LIILRSGKIFESLSLKKIEIGMRWRIRCTFQKNEILFL
jgi:hypothetical protein